MQDAAQRLLRIEIHGVRVRHKHHSRIVSGIVYRDHLRLRTRRKLGTEFGDRHRGIHRQHIRSHQPPHGEIAKPSDIGGAADRFAAQVQSPRGEGIAEQLARDLGRDDHRDQHDRAQPEVAGRFQRNERHRQRAADDGGRQRAHANDGVQVGVEVERRPDAIDCGREKTPADCAQKKRGEEQAAAEAGAERDHGCRRLQHEHHADKRQWHRDNAVEVQGAVSRRQNLWRL